MQCDNREDRQKILGTEVATDLVAIMGHAETDPILLTAVCTFALDVFETDEVKDDAIFCDRFYQGTKSMVELMPYLGFYKYPGLMERCAKYHAVDDGAEEGEADGLPE